MGVVVKAHGVKGQVKVWLHNPGSDALDRCSELTLEQGGQRRVAGFTLISSAAKGGLLIRIEGVEDLDQAEALRGAKLLVNREVLEPAEAGEYLYLDLMGCEVLDEAGELLGSVDDIFEAGASDVLVVRNEQMERMIPLVEQWIQEVDLEARTIRVKGTDQWEPYKIRGP